MRIKMLKTVRPDFLFMAKPGSILRKDGEYEAIANKNGAVCGICENGEKLGVKPGEFQFIQVPMSVASIWEREFPMALYGCEIV